VPLLFSPKSPQDASISGYAVFDMGSAGKAISRNGRINVPKAVVAYTMLAILAGSSCATIRRLWILAPMKSDHGVNSVETVKKLRLFTLVPFKDVSARVLRWNNQRIQRQGIGGEPCKETTVYSEHITYLNSDLD